MLRLVRDREPTAGDIATHFPMSRPAVSQHLRTLEQAKLVTVRLDGTRRGAPCPSRWTLGSQALGRVDVDRGARRPETGR